MLKPAKISLSVCALGLAAVLATTLPSITAFAQSATPSGTPVVAPAPIAAPAATAEPLVLSGPEQTELRLTATPIRIGDDNSLLMKPGEKKQVTLKVYNNSPTSVKILSLTEDFIIGEDGATPEPVDVAEADNRWSLKKWVTVVPNTQTIAAGETGAVSVLIEVPEDALPGGHYAMVLHQPDLGNPAEPAETKSTAVNQRVGTLLYVVVDGQLMEDASIRNLQIPGFQEFGPVPYSFMIDNNSDTHIQPKLTFNVYNIWGKRIASEEVESKNIFPKDTRDFTENHWDRIWGFGRYKGEVVAVYGSQSATKIASTYFWLFPAKIVMAITIGVLALVGIIIAIRRHMIHRNQDQSKRVRELEETVARMEQEKNEPPKLG